MSRGRGDGDVLLECHASLVEDEYPVGEEHCLVDVMGDEQDGGLMPSDKPFEQRPHVDPGEGVECSEGLVEEQHARIADEGAGQRDSLGLTA